MMELNSKNKTEFLKNKVYVLKFYASWCGPCKLLAPVFEQVSQKSKIPCASVNVDESATKDLVTKYQVKSVPTIIKIESGREIDRKQGFVNESDLTKFIG